ncbi:D-amino-acid oxidase [Gemmobacter nanjingensis]|uniref:D-amino-acid oxidase n=1 Tax=Gemmobacter nanjingensis TaxID=488454 RepID=A0ABQ3FIA1_9RHOB|nr:FAD-binding oxidoreductase [Gemmobacter nanjingensis]GHC25262.1 D-amino-acid oxidase [Gemmobacter nanjingensis]
MMQFLSFPLAPFAGDADLPEAADVVVIGGGIIGVCTALELAERGVSVLLCEKGLIGAEQSSRNWGWTRQMGRDPRELPLCMESLRLWAGMNERIGADTGWRRTGIAYLSYTRRELDHWRNWEKIGAEHGVDGRMLSRTEIDTRLPGNDGRILGVLHTGSDGKAEPWIAVPAIAAAARAKGARIVTGCAVRGLETASGRVSAVVTERGTVACQQVVIAAGMWSRLFAGNLGIDFPQLKVLGPVARVEGVPLITDMPVGAENFAFRHRQDGGYTIAVRNRAIAPLTPDHFRLLGDYLPGLRTSWRELSPRIGRTFLEDLATARRWALDRRTIFEQVRILNPDPVPGYTRKALHRLARAFPAFQGARITHEWAGYMDATPDAIPVIGPVPALPGLNIASGFSGHGFGIGPGAGRMMAQLILGENTLVPADVFAFTRLRPGQAQPAAA